VAFSVSIAIRHYDYYHITTIQHEQFHLDDVTVFAVAGELASFSFSLPLFVSFIRRPHPPALHRIGDKTAHCESAASFAHYLPAAHAYYQTTFGLLHEHSSAQLKYTAFGILLLSSSSFSS